MSTWLCLPSKRPVAEAELVLRKWRERGYKIALALDVCDVECWINTPARPDFIYACDPYPGYPRAVNALVKEVLALDADCQWLVCAGDDTWPDPNHTADEIAAQCSAHFGQSSIVSGFAIGAIVCGREAMDTWEKAATFGIMQPTGDDWSDGMGRIIERIAGSPWMGRSWCERINQGNGPLWHEYRHNWADQELQLVAQKYGAFWQRPDLTHYHDHSWRRPGNAGNWDPHQQWFSADYLKMRPLFEQRQRHGFPGSEPL